MGILTMRTLLYIGMIAMSGGVFLFTIIAGGLTWIRATNAGILQFHKVFSKAYYWICYVIVIASLVVSVMNFTSAYTCEKIVEDSKIIGIQAYMAYEELEFATDMIDEEIYLVEKYAEYQEKIMHQRQNGFFYLFMSMLWFSMMITQTGFITQNGYYPMCLQKPKKLISQIEHDEICFYLMQKGKCADKSLFCVKNNLDNRRYFAPILNDMTEKIIMEGVSYAEK